MVEPACLACCQSSLMPIERVGRGAAGKYLALIWSKSFRIARKSWARVERSVRSTMVIRPTSFSFE